MHTLDLKQDKISKLLQGKENILDSFCFDKVHAYMLITNWEWVKSDSTEMYIPSIDDLKLLASALLDRAIYDSKDTCSVGTGGLHVYKWTYGLKLTFDAFYKSSY